MGGKQTLGCHRLEHCCFISIAKIVDDRPEIDLPFEVVVEKHLSSVIYERRRLTVCSERNDEVAERLIIKRTANHTFARVGGNGSLDCFVSGSGLHLCRKYLGS